MISWSKSLILQQKYVPTRILNIKAEKIAHGLEEKNRLSAEKVIVSYTNEDKILAGFQKAVKERDAKFRNEVARVAEESQAEAVATHHYNNNGDPDDPKFQDFAAENIKPKKQLETHFQKVTEEKSENVESHIDHEVDEITGTTSQQEHRISTKRTNVALNSNIKSENVHIVKDAKEKRSKVHDASELQKYIQGNDFVEARDAAKKRAEAVEARIFRRVGETAESNTTAAIKTEKMTKNAILKSSKPKLAAGLRDNSPENLDHYLDHSPTDLKDYMQSPAYLKMRAAAERKDEIYAEDREKRLKHLRSKVDQSSEASNEKAAASNSAGRSSTHDERGNALEKNAQTDSHSEPASTHSPTRARRMKPFLAEDEDSEPQSEIPEDERSDEEPPEEPEDVPTTGTPEGEGLGEENSIRRRTKYAQEKAAARRAGEDHYVSNSGGSTGKLPAQEVKLGSKASKLSELRNYMQSKEFQQQESKARARSVVAQKLRVHP